MPDGFVSLLKYLRSIESGDCDSNGAVFSDGVEEDAVGIGAAIEENPRVDDGGAVVRVVREAMRASAALADALEMLRDDLLRDLACDVLARELLLAPSDITALVEANLARARAEMPIAVRVHPDDVALLHDCAVAVLADRTLRPGDAMIDVRRGSIDLTLGARLADVLAAQASP